MSLKDVLHLDKLRSSDIPTGAFVLLAIIVLVVAMKSAKLMAKLLFGLGAVGLLLAAIWWDLHNR